MPLISFKLAILSFRYANLSWINEEIIARLTWPSINIRRTNQLLGVSQNIISTTVAKLAGCIRVDTQKECNSHLTTSAAGADPLKKRRLLFTFFVNSHLLQGADTGYLALRHLSAWRSYRPLMSRTKSRLSSFRADFPARGSSALNVQPFRWPTSPSLVRRNLVSTETAYIVSWTNIRCYFFWKGKNVVLFTVSSKVKRNKKLLIINWVHCIKARYDTNMTKWPYNIVYTVSDRKIVQIIFL